MLRKLALVIMTMIIAFGNTKADEKLIELDVNKIPEWMTERIDKELHSFKDSGISQKELENLKDLIRKANLPIMHFEIIDNKLYYDRQQRRGGFIVEYLNKLLQRYRIPDVSFFLSDSDEPSYLDAFFDLNKNLSPVFVFAKDKRSMNQSNYILFPDDLTVANRGYGYWKGWKDISEEALKYNKKYQWEIKKNSLIWRGKKSDDKSGSIINSPRKKLVDFSIQYPNLIDAKFNSDPTISSNNIIQKFNGLRDFIMKKFGFANFITDEEFYKYKMLINVDGATCTYPGFIERLLSNSVTLKQDTDNEQWFYDAIRPWVHYIPVKKDLSDLIEKIEWVKNNDAEAKKIADASTKFVRNNLMMNHIDTYVVALLTKYAGLQQLQAKDGVILKEPDANIIPRWMDERIKKELPSNEESKITKDGFNKLLELINRENLPLVHFRIIKNRLYHDSKEKRGGFVAEHLIKILEKYKIPDVDFFLSPTDEPSYLDQFFYSNKDFPPVFVFAKDKISLNRHKYILLPDDYVLANRGYGYWAGWSSISKEILEANKNSLWQKKINLLFWRGKKSDDKGGALFDSPRQHLIYLSNQYPNLIDARFSISNTLQNSNSFVSKLRSLKEYISMRFSLGDFASKEEQVKYKMSMIIDGNTCTYPGFLWRLLSNSVSIKQETDNEQWFYDAVKPWVHYVPVKKDLSDLIEKIEWVKNNDAEAKKIADQSTEFVQNNLMMDHIDIYIVALLTEYAKLQQFKLERRSIEK